VEAIPATWKNGQIVPDGPVDWPEGCRLVVEPDPAQAESIGVREEDWDNSPEGIADWLAWYDSLEPLEFTPQEQAEIAAWRQRVKDHTIANVGQALA
jgi:hypothetical protein